MTGSNRGRGCLFALAIAAAVVLAVPAVLSLAKGRPYQWSDPDELSVLVVQILLVAAPFGLLAVSGITSAKPWVTALVLTGLFWGYYLYDGLTYTSGGADIGLGLLMMISPFIVAGGALAVHAITRKRTDADVRDD